jgi:hypothetical protein
VWVDWPSINDDINQIEDDSGDVMWADWPKVSYSTILLDLPSVV